MSQGGEGDTDRAARSPRVACKIWTAWSGPEKGGRLESKAEAGPTSGPRPTGARLLKYSQFALERNVLASQTRRQQIPSRTRQR